MARSAGAETVDGPAVKGSAVTEVAGYHDSVATSVLTPSVGLGVELPDIGFSVDAGYLVDIVTTASPDIVATASPRWEEVRHGGSLGARYKPGRYGISGRASVSYTPDYLSVGGSVTGTFDTEDKVSTFWAGLTYFRDVVGRTGTSFSIFSHTLDKMGLIVGWTGVLNRNAFLSFAFDGAYELGDPSKPYRYIPMFSSEGADALAPGAGVTDVARLRNELRPLEQLPTERGRAATTMRLGWRWDGVTLRLEERLYADTWRLLATTTDARLPLDAHERVRLWPHARLHAQSGVSFWERAYVAERLSDLPALRTGDRELGPLLNVGLGGGVRFALGPRGDVDAFAISVSGLGTYSHFFDALYITERYSALVALGIEAAW